MTFEKGHSVRAGSKAIRLSRAQTRKIEDWILAHGVREDEDRGCKVLKYPYPKTLELVQPCFDFHITTYHISGVVQGLEGVEGYRAPRGTRVPGSGRPALTPRIEALEARLEDQEATILQLVDMCDKLRARVFRAERAIDSVAGKPGLPT